MWRCGMRTNMFACFVFLKTSPSCPFWIESKWSKTFIMLWEKNSSFILSSFGSRDSWFQVKPPDCKSPQGEQETSLPLSLLSCAVYVSIVFLLGLVCSLSLSMCVCLSVCLSVAPFPKTINCCNPFLVWVLPLGEKLNTIELPPVVENN